MKRTILVFGAIAGVVASLMLVLSMAMLKSRSTFFFKYGELFGYTSMLLTFSIIFIAVKSYRDRYLNGFISFKDALLLGLGVAFTASTIYVLVWVVFYKTIFPDFPQFYQQCMIEKQQAQGKTAAELAESREQMQVMFSYYDTLGGLIAITYMEILPVGLIVALFSGLVLKKRPSFKS
ncbi:DUF4199 domain-containing protein [Siphonobacter curvatus]|uniref:DUF4199 domain-containing protein n=1 Tax=Siphonobacter curvatus TaxID=2094562 RepID=A0A2S7ITP6_9BACT|nr:DUF4199 domain-containing protein [Siphonobacter curvatus]PQA61008.1 DUF4199 domain-containing protein [Siphonobacter curvatus]